MGPGPMCTTNCFNGTFLSSFLFIGYTNALPTGTSLCYVLVGRAFVYPIKGKEDKNVP